MTKTNTPNTTGELSKLFFFVDGNGRCHWGFETHAAAKAALTRWSKNNASK